MVVVLPAPFGPTNATTDPRSTVMRRSRTAVTGPRSEAKVFVIPSMRTTGSTMAGRLAQVGLDHVLEVGRHAVDDHEHAAVAVDQDRRGERLHAVLLRDLPVLVDQHREGERLLLQVLRELPVLAVLVHGQDLEPAPTLLLVKLRELRQLDAARAAPGGPEVHQHDLVAARDRAELRSEERRVGKECRSRWSPYHYKKQKDTEVRRRTGTSTWK